MDIATAVRRLFSNLPKRQLFIDLFKDELSIQEIKRKHILELSNVRRVEGLPSLRYFLSLLLEGVETLKYRCVCLRLFAKV